jgi:hypothetical protein
VTDEQIKKALECCSKGFGNCEGCPYDDDNSDCVTIKGETLMMKDTLYLINRKDAEIERLNNELVSADEVIGFREAEIEILTGERDCLAKKEHDNLYEQTQKIRKAKSEAYKEFAERLQQEIQESKYRINDSPYARACNQVADWCIEVSDNLVKEMTEGGNEE